MEVLEYKTIKLEILYLVAFFSFRVPWSKRLGNIHVYQRILFTQLLQCTL